MITNLLLFDGLNNNFFTDVCIHVCMSKMNELCVEI